jgi:hypothetical protein
MSNAFPVVSFIISSFAVWSILSYPINYKELSSLSFLNTLIVPLGNAIPKELFFSFLNYIVEIASNLSFPYPPVDTEIK